MLTFLACPWTCLVNMDSSGSHGTHGWLQFLCPELLCSCLGVARVHPWSVKAQPLFALSLVSLTVYFYRWIFISRLSLSFVYYEELSLLFSLSLHEKDISKTLFREQCLHGQLCDGLLCEKQGVWCLLSPHSYVHPPLWLLHYASVLKLKKKVVLWLQ